MFRSTASFDRMLEKATSNLLLEPDWNAILQICDSIRSGDTNAKYAVTSLKKKFYHDNPHVVLYALTVLESCVKNCGSLVHEEIATRTFMEELRDLLKHTSDDSTKQKILEMLQTWGMAFRNSPRYRIVTETLNLMKAEGWKFPAVREAEAMFEADTAPEWAEGDVCNRCRVAFGMMTRRHHCRACGQVFCHKCSSKSCHLPKFGIEREVRVCDPCFDLFGPKEEAGSRAPAQQQPKKKQESDLPAEYLASALSKQSQLPQNSAPAAGGSGKSGKSEAEIKEEEELQLAIALSQSEAEEKEKQKLKSTSQILNKTGPSTQPAPNTSGSAPASSIAPEELDPELVRYLDRDYWEQKEKEKAAVKAKSVNNQSTGLPTAVSTSNNSANSSEKTSSPVKMVPKVTTASTDDAEMDEFVTTLKTQLEIFVNRMKSNSSRGRSITNDSSVQTLFMNTMAMHSKLLKHIQDQEDKRVQYEGLQDKLAQVKDARAALEALREEERERKRREAEEAERLRQNQMREKLELMRKKKTEYLQYQRQLAMQRMQEQEREMMLRQEQSRQQYHQQQMQYPGMQFNPYYPPGAYMMPPGTTAPGMPGMPAPPGTTAPGMTGMPAPPGTTAPGMPGMPAPPAATTGPQAPDATQSPATFNMASMSAALPGHPGAPMYPGAPYMMQPGGPMPQMPQPGMQPPTHQGAGGPQPPQQPPQQSQEQQNPRPPAPTSNADVLAELISFD